MHPRYLAAAFAVPRVRVLMDELIERHAGELSFEGIAKRLMAEDWILWVVTENGAPRAILATELYRDVGGLKRCRIPFCTGDGARGWVHLLAQIEAWARENDCARLDMIARKGWAKHLPDYRMTHVVLEKDLTT